jgi:pimeloyl-ACP methyl ester carboxylesterase
METIMTAAEKPLSTNPAWLDPARFWSDAVEYAIDAAQRTVLFWDVMRQRGNQYEEQQKRAAPNVLNFAHEIVMDGHTLPRPVNYGLVRIVPPAELEIDRKKRPFVIVDPRAGHGPGIGGFKADSEIGVAMRAGHPCYLVGFGTTPVPGQTIEDIAVAEAAFLERVIELHPEAEGKPAVIGNCQAGWAVMMLAAVRPELFGPIIIAGAPLSYWNGVRGANPMRYTGGLVGGSWTAALASDLGNGTFDGASLVQNFENLNPANTLWTKQYNLYSKIDTEAPRYLEFEKYWDVPIRLTAAEIQFIVDKLFVGNKLSSGDIVTTDGTRVDLRAIRSPIVVFCSKGDNITPPQQALGWILDLYGSVDDIRMYGQTIVYAMHESIGHLGIFVSGDVARKEHDEFASNIDLIDVLPPGLYEAVLREKTPDDANAALAHGSYIARFEARTLDDIRALGENDDQDERCFATVARVSEINHGLYRTLVSPFVQAATNESAAETLRRLQPLRLQNELVSDSNPLMRPIAALADQVRQARQPAAPDNVFLKWQEEVSHGIVESLNAWRDMRDRACERIFFDIYSLPALQAAVGERTSVEPPRGRHPKEPMHQAMIERQIAELKAKMEQGGIREAAIRALLYIFATDMTADERMFAVLHQIRAEHGYDVSLPEIKALVREQLFMLLVGEDAAVAAIRELAAHEPTRIPEALGFLKRVTAAAGPALSGDQAIRLARIERLLAEASTQRIASPAKASGTLALRRDGRSKSGGRSEETGDAPASGAGTPHIDGGVQVPDPSTSPSHGRQGQRGNIS